MVWALFNDIFQRIVTLDKFEQRRKLKRLVKKLSPPTGANVLDFACGTGLFARVFLKAGMLYSGYDIDQRLIEYGGKLHPRAYFSISQAQIQAHGPYDLILANCCFHHIDDMQADVEMKWISDILDIGGWFLMIDILKTHENPSPLRKAFMNLEQGQYLRTLRGYKALLNFTFNILEISVERSHVFSLSHHLNPLYNDIGIFLCQKCNGR